MEKEFEEYKRNKEKLQKEKLILSQKIQFFGERYADATLSKIELDSSSLSRILDWLKNPKNILVLLGGVGIGKTELCAAMFDWVIQKTDIEFVRYWSERKLFETLRKDIADGKGEYTENLRSKTDHYFVFLDDVGSTPPNDWRIDVLFNFLDYRYETMLPTVITSNFTKKQIYEIYGDRFGSRLCAKENVILDLFNLPDLRQEGY